MVYKARIDKEIFILPIVMVVLAISAKLCSRNLEWESLLVVAISGGVVFAFVLSNMLTIKYIITETELIIKTVVFKTTLKLDKITKIEQVKGIYSFSASSREQLKLTYFNGVRVCISPQNIIEFEKHLKRKNP